MRPMRSLPPNIANTAQVLSPALIGDAYTFNAPGIVAEIPGHGTQHVRPRRVGLE